jgi:DNA-binding response OmpR family regulator
MPDPIKLRGHRVLVVEDEYYIATDTARALRGAGAEVMGPCSNEIAANAQVAQTRPDAVIVDINLGDGPSFSLAGSLKQRGIPFLFVTGYDEEVIPVEFDDVTRLQKPVELRQMIDAISRLVTPVA